ncbi:MAG TPA: LuxR C-terminal-related transcriptional regulator [Chitinophagaceae bacterium]|nr:LuxR C-terminal-related transcriptional regulator [Chitinophagaceae bacterium]
MITTLTPKSYFEILKAQSERLLPEPFYTHSVSEKEQQKEITILKNTIHYEKFFFVINHQKFITEHVHGVHRWLGYNDRDFTLMKYFSIVHPSHLVAQMTNVYELLEALIAGNWPVNFMSHKFISTVALRHAGGEYLLFKRLAWPFQHDDKNRLLSYLNEFTLVGAFNNEPYSARMTDSDGNTIDWHDELLHRTKQSFQKHTPFSVQELRILRKLANGNGHTSKEIGDMFKIKESSVVTYKKRIMKKAEQIFHQKFSSAKHVAMYLNEQGLI